MTSKEKLHSIPLVLFVLFFLIFSSSVALAGTETRLTNNALLTQRTSIYGDIITWSETAGNGVHVYDLPTGKEIDVGTAWAGKIPVYGNKIVWADMEESIRVYDISTSNVTKISSDGNSPDIYGNYVVYTNYYSSQDHENDGIYLYDLNSHNETKIAVVNSYPVIYDKTIVWSQANSNSGYDICKYDIPTNQSGIITTTNSSVSELDIYGNTVVWTESDNVYMYDMVSHKITPVTNSGNAYEPAIYGNRIVYTDDPRGIVSGDIYMYEISTARTTRITTSNSAFGPSIYEDKIVYADLRNPENPDVRDIYIYDLSSTVQNPPVAAFTANVTSGTAPLVVLFTDTSTGGTPTSWLWDTGDGIYSKHAMNTTHTFTKPGNYTISLTAGNIIGNSTSTKPGYIVVTDPNAPVANFITNVTEGYAPLSIQFTDLSTNATEWSWDFGDGATSTYENPTHTYSAAGAYTVILTVSNANGTISKLSTINVLQPSVYAYITNMGSNNVSVIDISTNTVTATMNAGHYPLGVVVVPDGTKVYVANADGTVSIIDASTNNVTGTVEVGDYPYGIAVNPAGTQVYVTNVYSNTVSVIDITTNTVTEAINVGNSPSGIAVTPDGTKVYVTNYFSGNISIIETATNNVIGTVNVGDFPVGVAVNPDGKKVYVANINYPLEGSGRFTGTVSVIDTTTNNVITTVKIGNSPSGIVVNPAGTKVYVANYVSSNVSVIDTATNNVTASVNVGICPCGVAVSPDGTKVYVANKGSSNVSVIDTATNNVTGTVNVGDSPVAFGQFIGKKSVVPVSNFNTNTTQVIPEEVPELTEADNGRRINLENGDIFYLILPENPGTAYTLQLELSNGLTILSEKSILRDPPTKFEVPGCTMGVVHIWKIKANSEGSKQITGTYIQPVTREVAKTYTVYLKIGTGDNNDGSKGGSGGTGSSPEPAKNVEVKELCQVFVANGKTTQFDFSKNATCVVYVDFDAKKNLGRIITIVEMLKGKSTLVPELPSGETYKSFNVWIGNGGVASSKNIENPVVCFKVEKSWIKDKKIDQDSIILSRYNDKKWEQFPVNVSREDDKFLYFTAKTSGFSSFAITGTVKTPEETVTETEIDFLETINKGNTENKEPQTEQKEILSVPGFGIYYGVAGLLAVFRYKKSKKGSN